MSHQPERALTRSWCCGSTSSDTKCRNESSAREGIDTYLSLLSLCHIASCRNESSAREGIDTMRLVWICYPVFIRGRNESSAREGIDTVTVFPSSFNSASSRRNESSAREGIDTAYSTLSSMRVRFSRNESSAREGIDTIFASNDLDTRMSL